MDGGHGQDAGISMLTGRAAAHRATVSTSKAYVAQREHVFRLARESRTPIVAFVDKYGSTGTSHRVENVRSVKIGQVASWN